MTKSVVVSNVAGKSIVGGKNTGANSNIAGEKTVVMNAIIKKVYGSAAMNIIKTKMNIVLAVPDSVTKMNTVPVSGVTVNQ